MNCMSPNFMYRNKTLRDCTWKFGGKYTGAQHDNTVFVDGKFRHVDFDTGEVAYDSYYDYRLVRCGKCAACRAARAAEWTARLIAENETTPPDSTWFLTLTYAPEKVPTILTPEGQTVQSLRKKDAQDFMKRLRYYLPEDVSVRYFFCGEYGSKTFRPHYHAILYGIPREVVKPRFLRKNANGQWYYVSELIEKAWTDGYHLIAPANPSTMAYVARYTVKKIGKELTDERFGIQREFTLCSKRPALGSAYFARFADSAFCGEGIPLPDITKSSGRTSVGLPRTMKRKFWSDVMQKEFSKKALTNVEEADTISMLNSDARYLDILKARGERFEKASYASSERRDF